MSWIFLLSLLLGAPAPDAAVGDAAVGAAVNAAVGAAVGAVDEGQGAAKLLETVDATAREVSALRRIALGPKERLLASVVGRSEARERMEQMLRHQLPSGELELQSRMLQALGLLPRGADYLSLMLDAAVQEMAGFYDPSSRRLYVADWVAPSTQRPVLAHEIEHALQDRKFGLEKLLGLDGTHRLDSDAQLALQALAEGDATTVMMELLDPDGGFAGARTLAETVRRADEAPAGSAGRGAVPRFLRETMMFPYIEGVQFVSRVRSRRPWSAVDALWRRPPESTEQILHPEKYDRGESPLRIAAAPLSIAPEARELGADSLGELVLGIWLAAANPRAAAERAAAGWGGDRAVAYDIAGATAIAWLTVWDSEADSADFAGAAAESLAALARAPRGAAVPASGAALTVIGRDGALHGLLQDGTRVALLVGAPRGAEHVLREMLDSWTVSAVPAPRDQPAAAVRKTAAPTQRPTSGQPPRPQRSPGARR